MSRYLALLSLPLLALAACGNGDAEPAADSAEIVSATETTPETTEQETDTSAEETAHAAVPAPEGSRAGEAMTMGSDDAPLKIVEYASSTCPACAQFHLAVLPELKEKYIDTGLVQLEFREFPTHPQNLAYAGFYLSRCAATEKGSEAYFAMLKTLFERQRDWAYGPTPGKELENIAAQVGIDREELEDCFYREDVKAAVKDNIVQGLEEDNIRHTPTLLVDGREIDRGRSIEDFFAVIDAELEKAQQ